MGWALAMGRSPALRNSAVLAKAVSFIRHAPRRLSGPKKGFKAIIALIRYPSEDRRLWLACDISAATWGARSFHLA